MPIISETFAKELPHEYTKGESFSFLKKIKFIFNNQEATESSKPNRGSSSSYVLSIHITSSLSLSHETALL
jgi:hypothetical protein